MKRQRSWIFYFVFLVLFAPLGIFFMWKDKRFPKMIRWLFSIIFSFVFFSAILGGDDKETSFNIAESEAQEVAALEDGGLSDEEMEVVQGQIVTDSHIYEGGIKDGMPFQYGSFILNSGDKVSGPIVGGAINGLGEVFYANGDYYEGSIALNTLDGEGTYRTSDGDTVNGVWQVGHLSGNVVVTYVSGHLYEGEVVDWQKQGTGILTFSNDDIYSGAWSNDTYNGYGIYIFSDGQCYEGEWREGLLHGSVKYTDLNGTVYQGTWENGVCKKIESKK